MTEFVSCIAGERVALKVINKIDPDYDEEFLDREIMTMKKVRASDRVFFCGTLVY